MSKHRLTSDELEFLAAVEESNGRTERLELLSEEQVKDLLVGNLPSSVKRDYHRAIIGEVINRDLLVKVAGTLESADRVKALRPLTGLRSLPIEEPIIGRRDEIEAICRLLRSGRRLITLTGSGGIGKSRLARAVIAEASDDFGDSVLLVGPDQCRSHADINAALALALGLPVDQDPNAIMASRTLLLVVDGIQEQGQFALLLNRLLEVTIHLQVICTSRFPIGAQHEQLFAVNALKLKSSSSAVSDCVALLFALSRSLPRPGWELGVPQLTKLGARLGGIPLAVGLAAGCLANQSLAELEQGLDQTAETIFAQPWQSPNDISLRQVLMHSFTSLSNHDRHMLRCLSVIEGQFSEADATTICTPCDGAPSDLMRLQETGFIERIGSPESDSFRIHDVVLDFLASAAPTDDEVTVHSQAKSAHLALFADRANECGSLMREGRWEVGIKAIFEQLPNFRSAIEFAVEKDEFKKLSIIADGLARTYFEAGFISDFERLAHAACTGARRNNDQQLLVRMLGLQGALASRRSQVHLCEDLWQERLALSHASGDVESASDTLTDLAWHAFESHEFERALSYLDDAENLAWNAGVFELVATAQVIRARISLASGRTADGVAKLRTVETTLKQCTNRDLLLFVYQMLAIAYEESGEIENSRRILLALLSEASEGQRVILVGWALRHLAPMLESSGQLELAAIAMIAAEAVHREYATKHRHLATFTLADFESRRGHEVSTVIAKAKLEEWPQLVRAILDTASRQ
jgi:tetratricopeptide (TPR) repeat protein